MVFKSTNFEKKNGPNKYIDSHRGGKMTVDYYDQVVKWPEFANFPEKRRQKDDMTNHHQNQNLMIGVTEEMPKL